MCEGMGGVEGHQGPEVHSQQEGSAVSAYERDAYSHLCWSCEASGIKPEV